MKLINKLAKVAVVGICGACLGLFAVGIGVTPVAAGVLAVAFSVEQGRRVL
jgi:hypothetical protein